METKHKTIAEIGEFGLIDRIQKILPTANDRDVIVGIGDDAAVIRLDENRDLLITCDIQIENQHFRSKFLSPYQSGRRAMAVNLSDIAAMGGKPTFALVSLGLPQSTVISNFEKLIKGMRDQLSEFSGIIIGGNLSNTKDKLIIDITLMGEVTCNKYLTRSGAKDGDMIFVTGAPGSSGAGFHILEKFGNDYPKKFDCLVQKHLQPMPRIEIGRRIAQSNFATSMIDVSDGIASDLNHICKMSGVGAEIYEEKIPLSQNIQKTASLTGKSALNLALYSGEDYELLFTLKPDSPVSINKSIIEDYGVEITEIGQIITPKAGYYMIKNNGEKISICSKGWDHFRISEIPDKK